SASTPRARTLSKSPQRSTSISSRAEKGFGQKMAVRVNRIIRVIVIIIIAFSASLLLYLLINNFQFSRGRTVKVHFSSIGDLNNGSLVRRAGIKVGTVTAIEPAPDEKSINVTI